LWWIGKTPHPQPPQNQANCNAQKFAWWAAMCYKGLATKSLQKVRLRCKAGHASNTASAPPQNQLHLAECSRLKICMVGCGVLQGVGA